MNEEIKDGLKLITKGTKQVTKAALLKFKEGVDQFVDTVTDDKFEEKVKVETQAMAENFTKEINELKSRIEELTKEAAKEYKEEVDEVKEKVKEAVDDAAEEIKKEVEE
jgi:histone H3/H4